MLFSATISQLTKEGSTYYLYADTFNVISKHSLTLEEFIYLQVKDQINVEFSLDNGVMVELIRPLKFPKRRSKGVI